MSDYCDCCATNTEHIRQHYDPAAKTQPDERAEDVLKLFRDCFPEECPLDLEDVREYLDERKV